MNTEQHAGHDEPPVRYTLAGGRIGVQNLGSYLRTVMGVAFWLGAVSLPVRLLDSIGAHRASAWTQRQWAQGIHRELGLRLDMQGLEHIAPHETYIVTPLHEGLADAIAVLHLPLPLRFVVRDEFMDWPLVGAYLRSTKQICIRPEAGVRAYRQMVRQARQVVVRGESVVVFPQGSVLGIEIDFLSGAFALAQALERPILPIVLTGSHRVWEHPYGPRLRRGEQISLCVLSPIPVAEVCTRSVDELRLGVQRQLKAAALDGVMVPPRRFVPERDGFWDGYAYKIDPAFPDLAATIATHRETVNR